MVAQLIKTGAVLLKGPVVWWSGLILVSLPIPGRWGGRGVRAHDDTQGRLLSSAATHQSLPSPVMQPLLDTEC